MEGKKTNHFVPNGQKTVRFRLIILVKNRVREMHVGFRFKHDITTHSTIMQMKYTRIHLLIQTNQ